MASLQEIEKHLADGVAPDKLDKLMNDHGFVGPFKDSIYVCPDERAVAWVEYGQICDYKVMEAEEFLLSRTNKIQKQYDGQVILDGCWSLTGFFRYPDNGEAVFMGERYEIADERWEAFKQWLAN